MEIAIIGAGIGGLTTAIALQKKGFKTRIFEAATHLQPAGAGIVLAHNAVKAFEHLGIAPSILPLGQQLDQFAILNASGRPLSRGQISSNPQFSNFSIHRHLLHQALLSQLSDTPLELGKEASSFTTNQHQVQIQFRDGSECSCDYLIAADGIHSPIRTQIYPNIRPRYAGYTCWRGIAHAEHLRIRQASETWGPTGRMGMVPLPEGKVYWFACLNAPEKDPAMAQLSLKQLANYFATYHAPIPELLASKHPDAILHHDITDLPDLPQFAHGRVLLLGDAAHATTPNMGQGACQAIEDAVILAELCAQHPDLQQAFLSFDANRKARTQGIVRQSRRIGQLAQSQNRLVMAIRDTLLRLTPVRVQQRQLEKVLNVKF